MNPGEVLGPYRLFARLAHGGMGEVWEAEGPKGKVALKVIPEFLTGDAALVDRLKREAEAIRRLDHPGVVKLIECGEDGGRVFLAMELLRGETLAERLDRASPLPIDEIEQLAASLSGTLAYLHSQGIIHRDLKPQNVFLTKEGAVKLIDLGVAKVLDEASLTVTGSHFGTPAYMSPESFRDSKNVTGAADVWALGVMLYECATGRLPFPGTTAASIIAKISDTNVTPQAPTLVRPEIPERLAGLIGRCLERDPAKRPVLGTASHFHTAAARSRPVNITTAISTAVLAGLFLLGLVGVVPAPGGGLLMFFSSAILAGCALLMVRGYGLSKNVLLVRRAAWNTHIPLDGLISATVDPEAMKHSWRVWGNGGLFAICGRFRNEKLGMYRVFATDPARAVVLTFSNRTVVVTPTDPAAFASAIQSSCRSGIGPAPKSGSKGWRRAMNLIFLIWLVFVGGDIVDEVKNKFAYRTFYPEWTNLTPPPGHVVLAVKFSGLPFEKWDILIEDMKGAIRGMDTQTVVKTSIVGNNFWNVVSAEFQYAPSSGPVDAAVLSHLNRAVLAFRKKQKVRSGNFSHKVFFGRNTRPPYIDGWDDRPAAGQTALAVRHEGLLTLAELRALDNIFVAIGKEIPGDKLLSAGLEGSARYDRGGFLHMSFNHSRTEDDSIAHKFHADIQKFMKGNRGVKEAKVIEGDAATTETDVAKRIAAMMDVAPPSGRVVIFVGYEQLHFDRHYDLAQIIVNVATTHGTNTVARVQTRNRSASSGMIEDGVFRLEFTPNRDSAGPAIEVDLKRAITDFEQKQNLSGHIKAKMIYHRLP